MESKRIMCDCRCAEFVVAPLFVISCLLTCGCGRETSSTQQASSADYDAQKEMIEHIIGAKLPESVRHCKYHSKDYGMGHGTAWGYFEILRADLRTLLDPSDYLPDTSEFGKHHSRFDIEKYLERTDENLTWWNPLMLKKRQCAQKVIGGENVTDFFNRMMLPVINICVGEIRDDWMGVYLIYHTG
jgi:hypothetical protein